MRDCTPFARGALRRATGAGGLAYQVKGSQAAPLPGEGLVVLGPWNHPDHHALLAAWQTGTGLALVRGLRQPAVLRSAIIPPSRDLRRLQYALDQSSRLELARGLVLAKAGNQRGLLAGLRRRGVGTAAEAESRILADLYRLPAMDQEDAIRGLEGHIARTYFSGLSGIVGSMEWRRRPRCWMDPLNLLLDCCYARLCQQVALHLIDLDADLACGALHADDDSRPTLALDLMEPLRPLVADRLALRLLAHYQERGPQSWTVADPDRPGCLVLTPIGRAAISQAWRRWLDGSPRRPGQNHAIATVASNWRAWMIDHERAFDFPRLT